MRKMLLTLAAFVAIGAAVAYAGTGIDQYGGSNVTINGRGPTGAPVQVAVSDAGVQKCEMTDSTGATLTGPTSTQLPASLGQKAAAASVSVTPASDAKGQTVGNPTFTELSDGNAQTLTVGNPGVVQGAGAPGAALSGNGFRVGGSDYGTGCDGGPCTRDLKVDSNGYGHTVEEHLTLAPAATVTTLTANATACTTAGGASCTVTLPSTEIGAYPRFAIQYKVSGAAAPEGALIEFSADGTNWEVWDLNNIFGSKAAGSVSSVNFSGNARRYVRMEGRSSVTSETTITLTAQK